MAAEFLIAPDPIPLSTDADGVVRIGSTRVTLDTVVAAFREGATAETIAEQYPSLQLNQIYTVLCYYLRHQQEVNEYLERRRQRQLRSANKPRPDFLRLESATDSFRGVHRRDEFPCSKS